MTTKEKLLELLQENRGFYFSGEEIARKLCVSRAAVWKAVGALRNEGYTIDAATNKGYCLSGNSDIVSRQGIVRYLDPGNRGMNIVIVSTAASTNALVREAAESGAAEGYTVIADEQTQGRGRCGRQFFSPAGTGIYMSLLLRPDDCMTGRAAGITTMAAVAMCEAIEEISEEKAEIKWVNDIYVRGKKVCGILTEASFGMESGSFEYAVLGVGVNVYQPAGGFPDELKTVAGALFNERQDDLKNRLSAAFLNRFMDYYRSRDHHIYTEKYRSRSLAVGKQVTVSCAGKSRRAYVRGVDDECRLMVEYENGEEDCLSCGEISVRLS